MSNTASIAASVISEMSGADSGPDLSTPNQSTEAIADNRPDVIAAEVDHLINGDHRPTARVAAVHTSRLDERPWTLTNAGTLRRDTPLTGTAAIAREMIDLQQAFEGREVDSRDRRALAIEAFTRDYAAANPDGSMPSLPIGMQLAPQGSEQWHQAAEAALDKLIADSRERRK